MAETMSQDEVDQLLNAMADCGIDERQEETRRIKLYDFRYPEIFSKDNIRKVSYAAEEVVNSMEEQQFLPMHVAFIDQISSETFIRMMPCPGYIAMYGKSSDGTDGPRVLIHVDTIAMNIMSRKLAQVDFEEEDLKNQNISGIQLEAARQISSKFLDAFLSFVQKDAVKFWRRKHSLQPSGWWAHPNEMGVNIGIEVTPGGVINLWMPKCLVNNLFVKKEIKVKPAVKVDAVDSTLDFIIDAGEGTIEFASKFSVGDIVKIIDPKLLVKIGGVPKFGFRIQDEYEGKKRKVNIHGKF
jgi:flagellar motor switch protein FliM